MLITLKNFGMILRPFVFHMQLPPSVPCLSSSDCSTIIGSLRFGKYTEVYDSFSHNSYNPILEILVANCVLLCVFVFSFFLVLLFFLQWFKDVYSTDISDKCEDVLHLLSKTYGCQVSFSWKHVSFTVKLV